MRVKYTEIDQDGSFSALGIGFFYEYNARLKTASVSRVKSETALLNLDFDETMSKDALCLVRYLEKTSQIRALRFSNNTILDLAQTIETERLATILKNCFHLACQAYRLDKGCFDLFQYDFIARTDLKFIEIQKVTARASRSVYVSVAESKSGNKTSARSATLHGCLLYLSDKITQDIVAKEFGQHGDQGVQKLLTGARTLSTLSYILNHDFDPARKVKPLQQAAFSLEKNIDNNTIST